MSYLKGAFINEWMKKRSRICIFAFVLLSFFLLLFIASYINGLTTESTDDLSSTKTALQRLSSAMTGVFPTFLFPILMIGLGADIFSSEFSTGTMKTMLLRPISRLTILHSKLALLTTTSISLLLLSYILLFVFNLQHGVGNWNAQISIWLGTESYTIAMWLYVLLSFLLNSIALLVISSVILCISYFVRNVGFAIILTMLAIILPKIWLAPFQHTVAISRFYFSQHLDLVSHLTGSFSVNNVTFTNSLLILVGTGLFTYLLVAWRIRKDDFPC